jgi:hypothetical protein
VKKELIDTLVRAGLFSAERVSSFDFLPAAVEPWAGALPEEVLHRLRTARRFSVCCCCTSAGPLAALLAMKDRFGVALDIRYRDGTAQQQLTEMVRNDADYDFIVTGSYSLMFRTHPAVRRYSLLFPTTLDYQYALVRNAASPDAVLARPGRLFYIPETINEVYARAVQTHPSVMREIEVADLLGLSSDLDHGDVLLAWDPNATALASHFGLTMLPDSKTLIPISLCAARRLLNYNAGSEIVSAFSACFVAAWNHCDRRRAAAVRRLQTLPGIMDYFARGGTIAAAIKQASR